MEISSLLARLDGVKKVGSGWMARCPAHDDTNPSLSITTRDGKILLHCFAGCSLEAILSTLNLGKRDLFGNNGTGRASKIQDIAQNLLNKARDATPAHGYLEVKNIKPVGGIKQIADKLIIPVHDASGNLYGAQFIDRKGKKRFIRGTKKKGHFFEIEGEGEIVYVAEGYATAATIHMATKATTILAFDAGNLPHVARAIARKYQQKQIVICADADEKGVEKATEAARAINAKLAIPEFQDTTTKPTDFNDLACLEGIEMVKKQIENAKVCELPLGNIDSEQGERKTQSEILLDICLVAEFFHDLKGVAYAKIPVKGHREIWPVRSQGFKRWLSRKFYVQEGKAPNSQALTDTLNVLEGRAQFEGEEHEVFVRIGHSEGKIYLDLCNENWEVVEITKEGWQTIQDSPVYFRRTKAMASLPIPAHKGDITLLRDLLNIESEQDWILLVSWLVGCLSPSICYPVLALHGEQGAAKSTASRTLRSIIDPSTIPLRTTPRCEHDLVIAANNSWILAFDNLSSISTWLSDSFCRLSTGGGMSTRQLYSDDEEILFSAKRPLIINGISEIVTRHDLADRTMFVTLPPIPDEQRLKESELNAKFEDAHPKILGGLLDTVSVALRNKDSVHLTSLPRMADFVAWVVAGEDALPWETGIFLEAYTQNRSEIIKKSVESDPVANALLQWFEGQEHWEGTPTELLAILEGFVDEKTIKQKNWPKNSVWFSRSLTRVSSFLRKLGVNITRKKSGDRTIKIERVKKLPPIPSVPSNRNDSNKLDPDSKCAVKDSKNFTVQIPSVSKRSPGAGLDSKDSKDGKKRIPSKEDKESGDEVQEGIVYYFV